MHFSVLILALAAIANAKTDLSGCTSSLTKDQWNEASVLWYVPSSGEICAFLDCGGGAGAPVTTVAGCADYKGTATYSPSFLANFAASTTVASVASSTHATESSSLITSAPVSSSTIVSSKIDTIAISSSVSSFVSSASAPSATVVVPSGNSTSSAGSSTPTTKGSSGNSTSSSTGKPASASGSAGNMITAQGISGLAAMAAAGFAFIL